MTQYACPTCKARSRFNVIEQVATPVKINPQSGEMNALDELEPFHMPYKGPQYLIQCASCGTIEDEHRFIRWKPFMLGTLIIGALFAFILEPILIWMEIYDYIDWTVWQSFIVYLFIGVVSKAFHSALYSIQAKATQH
jgi:hypothetical protein